MFYDVLLRLLHVICKLLPLLCWTVYLSFLAWKSSDPKDIFLILCINYKSSFVFLLYLYLSRAEY